MNCLVYVFESLKERNLQPSYYLRYRWVMMHDWKDVPISISIHLAQTA